MANEESGRPLRRWRPFYGAFGAIDDAIEAAGHPRAAFRDTRVGILKLLRAATDDGVAEQLCAAHDDAMVEALQTLRVVTVPRSALASTDVASAVRALGNHGSARIRRLASDVVRGWRTANVVARATTVKEIGKLSGDPVPCQRTSTVAVAVAEGNVRGSVVLALAAEVPKMKLKVPPVKILPASAVATEEHKKKLFVPPAKMFRTAAIVPNRQNKSDTQKPMVVQIEKLETKKPVMAQSKKMEAKKPIVTQSEKTEAKKQPVIAQSEKMQTAKRKLQEGYEEAKRLKRQHLIQKINDKEAPKLLKQSELKIHRGPATCRTSSGVRRSLLPSLKLI